MPDRAWSIEKLSKGHDRESFDCGAPELDEYLQRFARQNEAAGIGQHFVAVDAQGARVIHGYYALSAGAVAFDHVPRNLRKRLPATPFRLPTWAGWLLIGLPPVSVWESCC